MKSRISFGGRKGRYPGDPYRIYFEIDAERLSEVLMLLAKRGCSRTTVKVKKNQGFLCKVRMKYVEAKILEGLKKELELRGFSVIGRDLNQLIVATRGW